MSGLDGFLDGIRRRLQQRVDRVAGIAYRDGMLYVAGLARLDEMADAQDAPFAVAFLESVMLQAEPGGEAQAVAEKAAFILAKKGWSDVRVVLAVDERETESIEAVLPPSEDAAEAQRMAHFEAARQLHQEPASFLSALSPVPGAEGGRSRISVFAQSQGEELRRACAAAGLALWAVAAPPESFRLLCEGRELLWGASRLPIDAALLGEDGAFHGWDESFSFALYGPALLVQAAGAQGCVFPLAPAELDGIAYGRIALAFACIWLALLACFSAWDAYGWYAARQEARQQQAELALFAGDAARMEDDRAEAAWTERQEQALKTLSAEESPAAGVLIHLGVQTADGVRLEELTMKDGNRAEIKGEAMTYDALSSYLAGFERDRAFFPDGPLLLDAKRPENDGDGTIHFSMELRMSGGEERTDAKEGT